jgi:L-alanine-DL-glutamate epimerase-like enolase superfamily enzyme
MSIGPALVDKTINLAGQPPLRISLFAYSVALRTAFGTSHSTSTSRLNGLVRLQLGDLQAFAEVGLPPKKAFVYEADLADIQAFLEAYCSHLTAEASEKVPLVPMELAAHMEKVLEIAPHSCYPRLRRPPQTIGGALEEKTDEETQARRVFCAMLGALDSCPLRNKPFGRAAASVVEVAATALLAKQMGLSVSQLILGSSSSGTGTGSDGLEAQSQGHCSFYTAALNEDVSEMVASAEFGALHTPHLKIKLDGNAERCTVVLRALEEWTRNHGSRSTESTPSAERGWFSLDANCAWSSSLALQLADELLPHYRGHVTMVEQPFPVDLVFRAAEQSKRRQGAAAAAAAVSEEEAAVDADLHRWVQVRAAINALGMDVYADESMRTHVDIPILAPYVNGVNIKMEKVGGYRAALQAIACAQNAGLKVWLGCMVGSNLNSTQTAALAPLVGGGSDLDGSLLVAEDSKIFTGGFRFGPGGTIVLDTLPGLGVELKPHVVFV